MSKIVILASEIEDFINPHLFKSLTLAGRFFIVSTAWKAVNLYGT